MLPHLLTNFEIQKYHQNEPKFNGFYWKNNLPKTRDGAYVINPNASKSIVTHWIDSSVNGNNVIYFDSFGAEHISKEIKEFAENKNMIKNIHRIQV